MKLSLAFKSIGLSILFVMLSVSFVWAQNFEGKVTYGIEYSNIPESTFYLKGEKSRFEQNMGMAGTQTLVSNSATKETFMLMDLMGQKLKLVFNEDELKVEDEVKPTVNYIKGSKKIAGYKCNIAEVTYPAEGESPERTVTVYYSKKIQGAGHSQFKMLNGFPMEYTSSMQGMEVTVSAKEVKEQAVSDEYFSTPEGYTEMTMEEFQKSMGMGGQE